VRGHANVLKRLLVHAGAFNLGLLMRTLFGDRHATQPPGPPASRAMLWSLVYEAIAPSDTQIGPGTPVFALMISQHGTILQLSLCNCGQVATRL